MNKFFPPDTKLGGIYWTDTHCPEDGGGGIYRGAGFLKVVHSLGSSSERSHVSTWERSHLSSSERSQIDCWDCSEVRIWEHCKLLSL